MNEANANGVAPGYKSVLEKERRDLQSVVDEAARQSDHARELHGGVSRQEADLAATMKGVGALFSLLNSALEDGSFRVEGGALPHVVVPLHGTTLTLLVDDDSARHLNGLPLVAPQEQTVALGTLIHNVVFEDDIVATALLLLREEGLDSCAQEAWAAYSPQVREMVDIPDDHIFFCGMAIGYRDPDAPVNNFDVKRAGLDESVRWEGWQ